MSNALHLTANEFDRMVKLGAFDHLDRKIELFRGELREMNPAGPIHDDLITYLTNWSVIEAAQNGFVVTSQTGLDLSDQESRPEPDLMWLKAKRYRDRHPSSSDVVLAIEVADSSLRFDSREKATLYAEAEIVEYWVVDAKAKCVHVFRDPSGDRYRERFEAKIDDRLASAAAPSAELNVRELFEGETPVQ